MAYESINRCERCDKPLAPYLNDTTGVHYSKRRLCSRCERIVYEVVRGIRR